MGYPRPGFRSGSQRACHTLLEPWCLNTIRHTELHDLWQCIEQSGYVLANNTQLTKQGLVDDRVTNRNRSRHHNKCEMELL